HPSYATAVGLLSFHSWGDWPKNGKQGRRAPGNLLGQVKSFFSDILARGQPTMTRIKFTDDFKEQPAVIRVVGLGGAGGNAVNRMIESELSQIEFVAAN